MSNKLESPSGVVSLGDLLRINPKPPECLIEPGLLPEQGILFVGGEPKVGKSLLVANLALSLAAGSSRTGFLVAGARRVIICQFELPTEQFAARLWLMRQALGSGADDNLFIDTRAAGHLLSSTSGLNHFLAAARTAAADVIVLDPLYSTHDQDENDTRAMAALCQTLLKLRDASRAAVIVVHHIRKSVGRYEIGSAFRGSSALHAVGDSYMLLTRPSPQLNTIELRFQFRYAAPQQPMLLRLDSTNLWFTSSDQPRESSEPRRKVEMSNVEQALASIGTAAGYNDLRHRIMTLTTCSKRTAQLAITRACEEKTILRDNGQYRLPLQSI
jgi:hypothetical protein